MKKLFVLFVLAMLTVTTAQAATATAPAASKTTAAASTADFQKDKDKRVAHAGDKVAEWQKKQTCAQAATTEAALTACFPAHGGKTKS